VKTVEQIAELAKGLSAQDRSRLMSMISFPSSRKGVIKSLKFTQTKRQDEDLVQVEFEKGPSAFLRKHEFLRIVSSFGRPIVFEIDEEDAAKALVGKHVLIEEHPTPKGPFAVFWRDGESRGDEGPCVYCETTTKTKHPGGGFVCVECRIQHG